MLYVLSNKQKLLLAPPGAFSFFYPQLSSQHMITPPKPKPLPGQNYRGPALWQIFVRRPDLLLTQELHSGRTGNFTLHVGYFGSLSPHNLDASYSATTHKIWPPGRTTARLPLFPLSCARPKNNTPKGDVFLAVPRKSPTLPLS